MPQTSILGYSTSGMPVGTVHQHTSTTVPYGFLKCDGTVYNFSQYPALAAVLLGTYGGNGTTTFAVPNLIGRTGIGAGTYTDPTLGSTTRTIGQSMGEASHILSNSEMPIHNHGGATGSHTHPTSTPSDTFSAGSGGTGIGVNRNSPTNAATASISNDGGGVSHNNMQPSLVTQYMIAYV
jgi:microcystin-dependent protein